MQEQTQRPKKQADSEPIAEDTFDIDTLKTNAMAIFGVPHYVIDAALHGQSPKPAYTKEEVRQAIARYNATPAS